MGRIKTGLVKRTSKQLIEKSPDSVSSDVGQNKKAIGKTMPSKRMKNMIAGYISRIKKNSSKERQKETEQIKLTK